jgi:hypothetical protein
LPRTIAGLASPRRVLEDGPGPAVHDAARVRLAMVLMGKPDTKVSELCKELGVSRQTLCLQRLARRRRSAGWRRVLARKWGDRSGPQTLGRGLCDHHLDTQLRA